MDWIDELEEHAWNVVIDELVWHLREQRLPCSIRRLFVPVPGVEFGFNNAQNAFLPVESTLLEEHWDEAVEIIGRFPELKPAALRSGA